MNVNDRFTVDLAAIQETVTGEWQATKQIADAATIKAARALDLLRILHVRGAVVRRKVSSSYEWMEGPSA